MWVPLQRADWPRLVGIMTAPYPPVSASCGSVRTGRPPWSTAEYSGSVTAAHCPAGHWARGSYRAWCSYRLAGTPTASAHSQTHTQVHTDTRTHTHTHTHTHRSTPTHAHPQTHAHLQTHAHPQTHTCMHRHTHASTDRHTHTHRHTHACTDTHTHPQRVAVLH